MKHLFILSLFLCIMCTGTQVCRAASSPQSDVIVNNDISIQNKLPDEVTAPLEVPERMPLKVIWIISAVIALLEVALRLIPSGTRTFSIISNIVKVLNWLIPDRVKDQNGTVRHLKLKI